MYETILNVCTPYELILEKRPLARKKVHCNRLWELTIEIQFPNVDHFIIDHFMSLCKDVGCLKRELMVNG